MLHHTFEGVMKSLCDPASCCAASCQVPDCNAPSHGSQRSQWPHVLFVPLQAAAALHCKPANRHLQVPKVNPPHGTAQAREGSHTRVSLSLRPAS
jgi:hypothetical protein